MSKQQKDCERCHSLVNYDVLECPYCGYQFRVLLQFPFIVAPAIIRPRREARTRAFGVAVAVLIGCGALWLFCIGITPKSRQLARTMPEVSVSNNEADEPLHFTPQGARRLQQWDRVQLNQTPEQVAEIVGQPASTEQIDGVHTAWKYPNSAGGMIVLFDASHTVCRIQGTYPR